MAGRAEATATSGTRVTAARTGDMLFLVTKGKSEGILSAGLAGERLPLLQQGIPEEIQFPK